MIVLGRKYKFTKFEKIRLRKKFSKRLIIKYSDRDPLEVLEELSKEDIVFSLINSRYLSESNLTITNKAYQDNTCFQVFNGDISF